MTRSDFGGTVSDYVFSTYSFAGRQLLDLASSTLTFWSAKTGGTQYSDLLLNGSAASSIPVGEDGQIPLFQGPDGITVLWASAGGARVRMVTTDGAAVQQAKTDAQAAKTAAETARTDAQTAAAAATAPTDTTMAAKVNDPASQTRAALSATYVPRWQPNTAYAAGAKVINPSGETVSANVAFASTASYSASNWTLVAEPLTVGGKRAVRKDEVAYNVRDYGAVGDGVANDTTAIQNALNAAGVAGGVVFVPAGTYLVTSTLTVGDSNVTVRGVTRRKSVIKAGGAITVLSVNSNAVVEDLFIDGGGVGLWGVKTTQQANKVSLNRVRVESCVDAGFVLESAQNGLLFDCTAQYSRIGYALYNGVANFKMINCNASNNPSGGSVAERSIVVANVTNAVDPRLNGTVLAGGNRNISVIGGIFERGSGDYQIELTHSGGQVSFIDAELVAGTSGSVNVASTFGTNAVQFTNVAFALGTSTTVAVNAASGRISHRGSVYSGTSGRHEMEMNAISGTASMVYSLTTSTTRSNVLAEASSFFQTSAGSWAAFGTGGTLSYDATKRRIVVGSAGGNNGARVFYDGGLGNYTTAYRTMKVTICVRNITGGVPRLSSALEATPFRRTIGTLVNGENTFLVEMTGDETGIEVGADSGTITLEVCYLTVQII